MKYSKYVLANALALTVGVLWIFCAFFIVLIPELSLQVTSWWFHGLNLNVIGPWNMTFSSFLFGGVLLVLSAWISGFTFSLVLKLFDKEQSN